MKKIIKKVLGLLLCMVLFCSTALAAPMDAVLSIPEGGGEYLENMTVVGDTTYFLFNSSIKSFTLGDSEAKVYMQLPNNQFRYSNVDSGSNETMAFSSEVSMKMAASNVKVFRGGMSPSSTPMPGTIPLTGFDDETNANENDEIVEYTAEQISAMKETVITKLISDGTKLYGLNDLNGKLFDLSDSKIKEVVQLDWKDMTISSGSGENAYKRTREFLSPTIIDNILYALISSPNENEWDVFTVTKYDLSTGVATVYDIKDIKALAPYKDGKLIARLQEPYPTTNTGKYVAPMASIAIFDPATGKIEKELYRVDDYNLNSAVYSTELDSVYFFSKGEIKRIDASLAIETVAYIPIQYADTRMNAFILSGGYLIMPTYNVIYIRSLDKQYLPERQLRIQGGYADETYNRFVMENPNIPVVFNDTWLASSEEMINSILSGDASADIYLIYSEFGLDTLKDKGYVADLSASQILADSVKQMYPQLQEAFMKDGKVVYYPQRMDVQLWSYNKELWDEVGLGELPNTFNELLDMMLLWENEYAEKYPNYTLFPTYNGMSDIFGQILMQYIQYYETGDAPLKFDTPIFREAIAKMEALPLKEYVDWEKMTEEDKQAMDEVASRQAIISNYAQMEYRDGSSVIINPLAFEENQSGKARITFQSYFVNPNSKNIDLAIKYLETAANNITPMSKMMMMPDQNEPIKNPYYEANIKDTTDQLAYYKEQLTKAKEEEKPQIQMMIDSFTQQLESFETSKWSATEEDIAIYREAVKDMNLGLKSIIMSGGKGGQELGEIMMRYMQGQINSDQMIDELDKKCKMMFYEDQ